MEEWTVMKGYEGVYWITKKGEIRNARHKKLQPFFNPEGVKLIELRNNGQREIVPVDYLVYSTFGGIDNEKLSQ